MLDSLVSGTDDPKTLAAMAKRKLKSKIPQLELALEGRIGEHQKRMLGWQLKHIDQLDEAIANITREVEELIRPLEDRLDLLETIPGVGRRTAEIIMATFGSHVDRFPSHKHLASWAGLCPGNNQSGGKRFSGRTRKGCPMLKTSMVEAAWGAVKVQGKYFRTLFNHLKARTGPKQAIIAVAHSLVTTIYHMLKTGTAYKDLGVNHFGKTSKEQTTKRAVKRLESLGYTVELTPQQPDPEGLPGVAA